MSSGNDEVSVVGVGMEEIDTTQERTDGDASTTVPGPFDNKTEHRFFKFIVEGKTYYLNPSFLAERSPFFQTLLYGDFKERQDKEVVLKNVSKEDCEEFLLVMGANPLKRKSVEVANLAMLLKVADMWNVSTVHEECVTFIEKEYSSKNPDVKTAVDIASICDKLGIRKSVLKIVASKLCEFSCNLLAANGAHLMLRGSTSAAVFIGSMQFAGYKDNRCYPKSPTSSSDSPTSCMAIGCTQTKEQGLVYCQSCNTAFCEHHSQIGCSFKISAFLDDVIRDAVKVSFNFNDYIQFSENLLEDGNK